MDDAHYVAFQTLPAKIQVEIKGENRDIQGIIAGKGYHKYEAGAGKCCPGEQAENSEEVPDGREDPDHLRGVERGGKHRETYSHVQGGTREGLMTTSHHNSEKRIN